MAATRSGSSEDPDFGDLRLRPEQRGLLSRPMGPVRSAEAARAALAPEGARQHLSTCGDVVTATVLNWGWFPFVAVVDGKTLRDQPFPLKEFDRVARGVRLSARNPAGEVTADLQRKVHTLCHGPGGLLVVEGEEDLAVLPLVRELPLGTTVLYGQPGAGVCFLAVDAAAKERVKQILDGMEARPATHGH